MAELENVVQSVVKCFLMFGDNMMSMQLASQHKLVLLLHQAIKEFLLLAKLGNIDVKSGDHMACTKDVLLTSSPHTLNTFGGVVLEAEARADPELKQYRANNPPEVTAIDVDHPGDLTHHVYHNA